MGQFLLLILVTTNVLFGQFYVNDTFFISKGTLVSARELDITIDGGTNFSSGTFHLNGSSPQVIQGSSPLVVDSFVLENISGVVLQNQLVVNKLLKFVSGVLTTNTLNSNHFVEFQNNSVYTGYGSSSYVDGMVKKTGNQSFTFPIGNGIFYAPMSISAPSSATDQFIAFYKNGYPPYSPLSKTAILNNVSRAEYWMLNRTTGSSNVNVSLSWSGRSGGIGNISDLRVAHWNGTQWTDEGNTNFTGNTSFGTITSNLVSSFSPFTLASVSVLNPLPIELVQFIILANQDKKEITLKWSSASEKNTDFFEVQRSVDNISWETVGKLSAAGNSVSQINYNLTDEYPNDGINYYRIKTVDTDLKWTYSEVKFATITSAKAETLSVYPNPILEDGIINLKSSTSETYKVYVSDILGNRRSPEYNLNNFEESISLKEYAPGIYFLNYSKNGNTKTFKLVKN